MYTGSLDPVSNQEDWQFAYRLWDEEANEFIDITGCTVTITVRDQNKNNKLIGSTTDGNVALPGEGVFEVLIPESDMNTLCAGTYDVGVRIQNVDRTVQLIIGSVVVLDGVDMQ